MPMNERNSILSMGTSFALFFLLGTPAGAQTCVVPPPNLISWWDADSISGTTALDIADANDGAMTGTLSVFPGFVGNAFDFHGTGRISGTLNGFAGGDSEISVAAWFNQPAPSVGHPGRGIFGVGNTAFKAHFFLRLSNGDGALDTTHVCLDGVVGPNRLCVGADDGADRWWASTAEITNDAWHFAVATYMPSGQELRIYVDGQLDRIVTVAGGLALGTEFWIGGDAYDDNFLVGLVDEIQAYGRALTAEEVRAIFAAGTKGVCKGLLEVRIDIKPGSDPNSINLNSAGSIPVAIFSTPDFDAPGQVDRGSLRLGGAAVNLIGRSDRFQCSDSDVNGDGLLDLVCHFQTEQFMIEPGDSMAVLEGKTLNGQTIRGEDSVRIVP